MTSPEELDVSFLFPGHGLALPPQLIIRVEVLASLQRSPARSQAGADWPPPAGSPTIWHEVFGFPRVDGRLDTEQPPGWWKSLVFYILHWALSCWPDPTGLTDWQTSLHNNSQHQLKASAVTVRRWRQGGRGDTKNIKFFMIILYYSSQWSPQSDRQNSDCKAQTPRKCHPGLPVMLSEVVIYHVNVCSCLDNEDMKRQITLISWDWPPHWSLCYI